jgi:hypothetical protein
LGSIVGDFFQTHLVTLTVATLLQSACLKKAGLANSPSFLQSHPRLGRSRKPSARVTKFVFLKIVQNVAQRFNFVKN